MSADGLELLPFPSAAEWEAWLEEHHASSGGVRIKFAKKGSGIPTVVYAEAVEVALCFGWIDGQVQRVDDSYHAQRFTPRRKRSSWSRINTERALALIESGRMRPAGLAEVERAREDGRWDAAYEPPSRITVPDDLQAALDANPAAAEAFAGLNSINRYGILYRVGDARRPATRARRIEKFVTMLAAGERLHD